MTGRIAAPVNAGDVPDSADQHVSGVGYSPAYGGEQPRHLGGERSAELDAGRRRGRLRLDVERVRRALPEQDQGDGGGDSSESARSRNQHGQ